MKDQQRVTDARQIAGIGTNHGPAGRANAALWVLQGLVAAFFAFASALPKLIAHSSATDIFDRIGYGDWFMYLIGSLELAGAIALVIPLLAGVSALAFIGLMTGAFVYGVTVLEGENFATPLILIVIFALIAWGRRHSIPQLAKRLTRIR